MCFGVNRQLRVEVAKTVDVVPILLTLFLFAVVSWCVFVVERNRCGGGALAVCGMGSFDESHHGSCCRRKSDGVTPFWFERGVCALGN